MCTVGLSYVAVSAAVGTCSCVQCVRPCQPACALGVQLCVCIWWLCCILITPVCAGVVCVHILSVCPPPMLYSPITACTPLVPAAGADNCGCYCETTNPSNPFTSCSQGITN